MSRGAGGARYPLKNTRTRYGAVSVALHWIVAVAVFGTFALGFWMVELTYYDDWYKTAPYVHKSVGILLFVVVSARALWRVVNVTPAAPAHHGRWERVAARWSHRLMYALLFAVMIAGYLISTADGRDVEVFGWFAAPGFGSLFENQEDLAGDVHRWLAYALIGVACVHALAAFKHHVVDRDDTLLRMIGSTRRSKDP